MMSIVRKHLATLRRMEATKFAKRGGLTTQARREEHPSMAKARALIPKRGELCQASLRYSSAANLPDKVKPTSAAKQRMDAPVEPVGVRGESGEDQHRDGCQRACPSIVSYLNAAIRTHLKPQRGNPIPFKAPTVRMKIQGHPPGYRT